MLVLKGSIGRVDEVPSIHSYGTTLRNGLKEDGTFITTDRGLELTKDYEFSSPSTAAMVLLGRTSNGRKEWKNTDGVSLGALQARDLEGSGPNLVAHDPPTANEAQWVDPTIE
jgi:hypothetical protein